MFAVRQVREKYLANEKNVFWAFMDRSAWYVADAKSMKLEDSR